jgi:HTH-type transcriptional regulator/antitoxin HipB
MEYHIRTLEQFRPILVGFRKQAGLSQTEVASLLGVTQQSYAKIEANPSATSVERLYKILSLLGADIILGDRVPSAEGSSSTRLARSETGDATPVSAQRDPSATSPGSGTPIKRNSRKTPPAPPKLIPPSKKTESW